MYYVFNIVFFLLFLGTGISFVLLMKRVDRQAREKLSKRYGIKIVAGGLGHWNVARTDREKNKGKGLGWKLFIHQGIVWLPRVLCLIMVYALLGFLSYLLFHHLFL